MTTGMTLPIAKNLDNAGSGIELISGSHLKKTLRELKEDLGSDYDRHGQVFRFDDLYY